MTEMGAERTPTRQSTWVSFPHPPAPSEAAPSRGRKPKKNPV